MVIFSHFTTYIKQTLYNLEQTFYTLYFFLKMVPTLCGKICQNIHQLRWHDNKIACNVFSWQKGQEDIKTISLFGQVWLHKITFSVKKRKMTRIGYKARRKWHDYTLSWCGFISFYLKKLICEKTSSITYSFYRMILIKSFSMIA